MKYTLIEAMQWSSNDGKEIARVVKRMEEPKPEFGLKNILVNVAICAAGVVAGGIAVAKLYEGGQAEE